MKLKLSSSESGKFGLVELFVVLFVMVLAAALVLPMLAKSYARSSQVNCINNMKQVGLSFRLWGSDNGDKMPMQVSNSLGGTMELIGSGAFPHFAVMSNELGTPKVILCPNDANRHWATNFASLKDSNISYFVAPEANQTVAGLWLSGDHNLATNSVAVGPGLITFPTSRAMSWTAQLHNHKGNMAMADGSVQQLSDAGLQRAATNAIRAYRTATTNAQTPRLIIP